MTLHITNGDILAQHLRAAGLEGEVLPWRDVLHDGPVPGGVDAHELRRTRARFIAAAGWGDEDSVRAGFASRDAAVRYAAVEEDEIVLWFEHDLYDQLQLLQVLDAFSAVELPRARLTMVRHAEVHLGLLDTATLARLFPRRRRVAEAQREVARRAWAAFRAPEPTALGALLDDPELEALPDLPAAIRRLLEELPGVRDGLSRTERQTLEALAAGPRPLGETYRAAHHEREEAIYLGDGSFALVVQRLASGAHPLVEAVDGAPLRAPTWREDTDAFWRRQARLTSDGAAVLAGRADHVRLNHPDRWLGGTHLGPGAPDWRWDGERVVVAG